MKLFTYFQTALLIAMAQAQGLLDNINPTLTTVLEEGQLCTSTCVRFAAMGNQLDHIKVATPTTFVTSRTARTVAVQERQLCTSICV
jgi:hypothetical protein